MKEIEDQLRKALRRQEPPPGFAARVAAEARQRSQKPPWWSWWRRWAAVAAIVLIVASAVEYRRQRAERLAGEAARQQVLQALHITGAKLRLVQAKVRGAETSRSE